MYKIGPSPSLPSFSALVATVVPSMISITVSPSSVPIPIATSTLRPSVAPPIVHTATVVPNKVLDGRQFYTPVRLSIINFMGCRKRWIEATKLSSVRMRYIKEKENKSYSFVLGRAAFGSTKKYSLSKASVAVRRLDGRKESKSFKSRYVSSWYLYRSIDGK